MKKLKKYYGYVAALLLVVAVVLFLVCPVTGASSDSEGYSGFKAVFGYTEEADMLITRVETEILLFSTLNLVAVVLAIFGALIACIKKVPFKSFVVCILAVASGVLMMLVGKFTKVNENAQTLVSIFGGKIELVTLALGYVSGAIAIVSGVSFVVIDILVPNKKHKKHRK